MSEAKYAIAQRVAAGYDEAVAWAREALKEQGFGVMTEIDVKKTMKEKLDLDYRPYVILGACNPGLAHEALTAEPDIGLMLPCNVVVYEATDGECVVEAVSPIAALGVVENPALLDVAERVTTRLTAAMEAVGARARENAGASI